MSNPKRAAELEGVRELGQLLCTCQGAPLGLPFTLTLGCLIHDRCVCHELVPQVDVLRCAWCDSYVCLLRALADLPTSARQSLQQRYVQLCSGG